MKAPALALWAGCALAALPAAASERGPMTFTLGRLEGSTACGGACAQFIVATGEIGHASTLRFLFARKLAGDRDLPVLLTSPGGFAFGAQGLGRTWRRLQVTTVVAAAQATCGPGASPARDCDPADRAHGVRTFRLTGARADCASACPMLLAGATRRIPGPRARLGVHRGHFDEDTALGRFVIATGSDQDEIARSTAREMGAFFSEMGVEPSVAERSLKTPPDSMDWLKPEEAQATRLFNAKSDDAALAGPLRAALRAAERGQEPRRRDR